MKMNTHEHNDDVIRRLSRIEGHVRGIKKMLEDGQSCDQVLLQLSAVRAALNKATKILLEDHFDNCVLNKNKDKALEKELMEFRKTFDGFLSLK
ncbi:MAG: metal-sensitive transcriptional regulator [Deltaproteobacteria bacterium]|nr:metal-sensitive transcriptional regulator [Deltaproteobacteria bacterium]